jgi:chromatin segregation and condensation protein Rec8/ScpA/Scc1 (kleisin family)
MENPREFSMQRDYATDDRDALAVRIVRREIAREGRGRKRDRAREAERDVEREISPEERAANEAQVAARFAALQERWRGAVQYATDDTDADYDARVAKDERRVDKRTARLHAEDCLAYGVTGNTTEENILVFDS